MALPATPEPLVLALVPETPFAEPVRAVSLPLTPTPFGSEEVPRTATPAPTGTSSFAPGDMVPTPTLLPDWNSTELPSVVPLSQMGMKFFVPAPATVASGLPFSLAVWRPAFWAPEIGPPEALAVLSVAEVAEAAI